MDNEKRLLFKAYRGKGLSLAELGRYEEALVSFNQALLINENDSKTLNNKAFVLSELERFEESLACYEKAISVLEEEGVELQVRSEESTEYIVGHGGKREGSGRKVVGETKKVSISLPHGDWERLDKLRGEESRSAFLRELILKELEKE